MKKKNAIIERRYEFNVISYRSIIEKYINIIINNEDDNNDQKTYKLNFRKKKIRLKTIYVNNLYIHLKERSSKRIFALK